MANKDNTDNKPYNRVGATTTPVQAKLLHTEVRMRQCTHVYENTIYECKAEAL